MIPFADLKAQYQQIKAEIDTAVLRTLESGQFILGSEVAAFEEEFARYCGGAHAVAVNSGTSALHLALLAAGIAPGDEVITVPCTFVATVAAIDYCGARPVFIDVEPGTWTMDPDHLERAITPRTKAILPVHLYGHPANMNRILEIAGRHGIPVIEDAAQAHGAEYKGRRVGTLGVAGCFSFYPGKNLGAYGEGGAVVTDDPELARKIRMLRDWGQDGKHNHVVRGFNYRMDGLQGAILRVKLRYLEAWNETRRERAGQYSELLAESGLSLPVEKPGCRHVFHVYGVLSQERQELLAWLDRHEIQTGIHYPNPVHLLPAWSDLGYAKGAFPVSEKVASQELSLPLYAELSEDSVSRVAQVVRQFAATRSACSAR